MAISHVLGVYRDIPAPDVNTNAQVMAWMMDAFSSKAGYSPACVTGKPLDLGGAPGREAATGRGCVYVLEARPRATASTCRSCGSPSRASATSARGRGRDRRAGRQGRRAVRCQRRRLLRSAASTCTRLGRTSRPGRRLVDLPGTEQITKDELIACACDVLVPAALGEVITDANAGTVQARVVLEAANYPVTPGGDKILGDRGVEVIPDILANAGGVTGSYFEWAQNIQQFTWTEERFNEELKARMTAAFAHTAAAAAKYDTSLRRAAFAIGIERVANASKMRGYVEPTSSKLDGIARSGLQRTVRPGTGRRRRCAGSPPPCRGRRPTRPCRRPGPWARRRRGWPAPCSTRGPQVGDEPLGHARLGVAQGRAEVDRRRPLQAVQAPAQVAHLVEHAVDVEVGIGGAEGHEPQRVAVQLEARRSRRRDRA